MAFLFSPNPSNQDILAFMDEDERRDWHVGKGTPEERVQCWESLEALWRRIPDPTAGELRQIMRDEDWRVCQEDFRNRDGILNFYRQKWKLDRKVLAREAQKQIERERAESEKPSDSSQGIFRDIQPSQISRSSTPPGEFVNIKPLPSDSAATDKGQATPVKAENDAAQDFWNAVPPAEPDPEAPTVDSIEKAILRAERAEHNFEVQRRNEEAQRAEEFLDARLAHARSRSENQAYTLREFEEFTKRSGFVPVGEAPPPDIAPPWHKRIDLVVAVLMALGAAVLVIVALLKPITSVSAVIFWLALFLVLLGAMELLLARHRDWSRLGTASGLLLPFALTIAFGWYAWPEVKKPENDPSSQIAKIQSTETATSKVKVWGTSGERNVFAVVDASQFMSLADGYGLMMICRVQDNKTDRMKDIRIEKSAIYSISENDQRLELTLSQDSMRRLIPQGWVNVFILLVPAKVDPALPKTVDDFVREGAYVVGNPSLLVTSNVEPPPKQPK